MQEQLRLLHSNWIWFPTPESQSAILNSQDISEIQEKTQRESQNEKGIDARRSWQFPMRKIPDLSEMFALILRSLKYTFYSSLDQKHPLASQRQDLSISSFPFSLALLFHCDPKRKLRCSDTITRMLLASLETYLHN